MIGNDGAPPQPWVEVKSVKPEGAEYAIYFKAEWRFLASARPLILQAALSHLAQAGLEPAVPRQNTDTEMGLQVPGKERLAQLIGEAPMLRPGDLFDPSVVLLGEAHACTVRARTPALLCELDYDVINRLFRTNPEAFDVVGRNLAALVQAKSISLGQEDTGEGEDWADEARRQMRHLFPGLALPSRREDAAVIPVSRKAH